MKIYDGGKIIPGIIIAFACFSFPVWYNLVAGGETGALEPVKPEAGKCVVPAEEMRVQHMTLLTEWRDRVVRDGERIAATSEDDKVVMSLRNTCMECHESKERFCDRCHNYASVEPDCWNCHIEPGENE